MKRINKVVAITSLALAIGGNQSAQAQTYFLSYQMIVGSTDSNTQNNSYNSGAVQSTNLLTVNLAGAGSVASAYATPTASYGWLQLTAVCSVNNTSPGGSGHLSRFTSTVGGGADVFFADTLTITSATLPTGTPVQVQISCGYGGSITPGVTTSNPQNYTDSSASVGLFASSASVSGLIGGVYQTNVISRLVNTTVGDHPYFRPSITATGNAVANTLNVAFSGSVNAAIMSQTYVDVLTPGASYTSASGTRYPALLSAPPTLRIQPATNGVVLLWPALSTVYRVQQNSSLTTANWASNTIPIYVVNGTNQVTVSPADGNMFFRLISP